MQKIRKSNISITDIEEFLKINKSLFIEFSVGKLSYFHEEDIHNFVEQEEMDKDDDEEEELTFYRDFLLGYLIELYFLKSKPDELYRYVEAIKIPKSKRYCKELISIYDQAVCKLKK